VWVCICELALQTITIIKDHLRAQCDVARNMFTTQPSDCLSAVDVYCRLLEMSAAFPDLLACYQVALTLPVASASAERSFSTLRRIKTHLRSTMADDRLSNLAVIAVLENSEMSVSRRQLSGGLLENPAIRSKLTLTKSLPACSPVWKYLGLTRQSD
jgi:hypothetical protein